LDQVVIGTDCTGSCKSKYNTITTTTELYLRIVTKYNIKKYVSTPKILKK